MTLAHLAPFERWYMRVHVWLMGLWSVGLAVAANAAFRQTALLDMPVVRHALNGLALYFLGLLPAVLFYLRWHQRRLPASPVTLASEDEKQDYLATQASVNKLSSTSNAIGEGGFHVFTLVGEIFPFVGALALVVGLLFVLPTVALSPLWLGEWLASGLAELVFEFVIGYGLIRHANIPATSPLSYRALLHRTRYHGAVIVGVGLLIGLFRKFHP